MPLDNDDIKQLIQILQKGLSDNDNSTEDEPERIPTKKRKVNKNKQSNNKFISLGFHNLHKEDIAVDKLLKNKSKTPRNRSFKPIKVRCRVCGREESINPSLLYEAPDRYKCNKCSSSPG
jgi:hypothetical protein